MAQVPIIAVNGFAGTTRQEFEKQCQLCNQSIFCQGCYDQDKKEWSASSFVVLGNGRELMCSYCKENKATILIHHCYKCGGKIEKGHLIKNLCGRCIYDITIIK